jgi:hypothetical protein
MKSQMDRLSVQANTGFSSWLQIQLLYHFCSIYKIVLKSLLQLIKWAYIHFLP